VLCLGQLGLYQSKEVVGKAIAVDGRAAIGKTGDLK
jgi:hypothetical protein